MRSFRSKPVGWARDNYRHYLAAKYGHAPQRYMLKFGSREEVMKSRGGITIGPRSGLADAGRGVINVEAPTLAGVKRELGVKEEKFRRSSAEYPDVREALVELDDETKRANLANTPYTRAPGERGIFYERRLPGSHGFPVGATREYPEYVQAPSGNFILRQPVMDEMKVMTSVPMFNEYGVRIGTGMGVKSAGVDQRLEDVYKEPTIDWMSWEAGTEPRMGLLRDLTNFEVPMGGTDPFLQYRPYDITDAEWSRMKKKIMERKSHKEAEEKREAYEAQMQQALKEYEMEKTLGELSKSFGPQRADFVEPESVTGSAAEKLAKEMVGRVVQSGQDRVEIDPGVAKQLLTAKELAPVEYAKGVVEAMEPPASVEVVEVFSPMQEGFSPFRYERGSDVRKWGLAPESVIEQPAPPPQQSLSPPKPIFAKPPVSPSQQRTREEFEKALQTMAPVVRRKFGIQGSDEAGRALFNENYVKSQRARRQARPKVSQ